MRFLTVLALLLTVAAANAAGPGRNSLDGLFTQLRAADNAEDAKALETQILGRFLASGSPSVDLLMNRANAALSGGNKDIARKLFDTVTEIAPRYAEGWHRRGLMQSEAGQDAAAMVSLQKAVELNPRQFEAMEQLAEMLEDYGDKAGALKMYRKAFALDPHFEGLERHINGLSRDVEGQGI